MKFNGQVCSFDDNALYWELHIPIPDAVFNKLYLEAKDKRVICTINNDYSFHCAMFPKVTFHYILLTRKVELLINNRTTLITKYKNFDSSVI